MKYIFAFPFASKEKEKTHNSIYDFPKEEKYWEIDCIGQKRENVKFLVTSSVVLEIATQQQELVFTS